MINRREFIQAGALSVVPLATGAGLLSGAAAIAAPAVTGGVALHTVVYDERFADSLAFGREAGRLGYRASAIRGDVTDLWYHDLYHRWKQGPAAVAGLTTTDALFCLETFGNDAGLRLVMKAEHRLGEGGVQHRLTGPARVLTSAALDQCGPSWSGRMAQLVTACPASRADRIQTTAVSRMDRAAASDQPVLVSWLLVPAGRRFT